MNFVWANDARAFLAQRQTPSCHNENNLYVLGSKGSGQLGPRGTVVNGESEWKYRGPGNNMYQTEHDEMFAAIRAGKPINDGERGAFTTHMALMARMAAYTGQTISWDQALNSTDSLTPESLAWGEWPAPVVAVPGKTKFV